MKKQKAKNRLNIFLLIVFIAAVVYLYVQIYMIPDITGALTSTQIVSYGQIETSNDGKAMIVRDEEVTCAEQGGTVSYYAADGEKTRVNAKVLDVYPAGQKACPYYCKLTGFISYAVDGLEDRFNLENAAEVSPSFIMDGENKASDVTEKNCEKGDPLYKTVTSDEWVILIAADLSYRDRYTAGDKITVRFYTDEAAEASEEDASEEKTPLFPKQDKEDGEDQVIYTAEVPASVYGVYEKEGMLLVAARSRRYFEGLASARFLKVNAVTSSSEGLLLAKTAVVTQDGVEGVYKKEISGEYSFVPVQVISSDEENCIVTPDTFTKNEADGSKTEVSTIKIYDEILKNGQDAGK